MTEGMAGVDVTLLVCVGFSLLVVDPAVVELASLIVCCSKIRLFACTSLFNPTSHATNASVLFDSIFMCVRFFATRLKQHSSLAFDANGNANVVVRLPR